ncbi:MAG: sensor histidine kinase [Rhizobiaceae bacterium]
MRLPRSLSLRLMLVISLWSLFALALTGLLISNFYRTRAETDFRELLLAHAYNLMGSVETDAAGSLKSIPNLGDPRFLTPDSGWYWAVAEAGQPEKLLLSSPALASDTLDVPPVSEIPFGDLFRRSYTQKEPSGAEVERLEAQLFFGEADKLFQVTVAGNRSELEHGIAEFNWYLLLFLGLFGAGTIAATALIVRLGFKPLDNATNALVAVRIGETEQVEGTFPTEIEPFVDATNDLIEANRSVLERSRTHVGNLAHALKTPLAVIMNESSISEAARDKRIGEQANLMREQISSYLSRAQISAQRRTLTARTPVEPVVEKLSSTMAKLFRNIDFDVTNNGASLTFRGEKHDLEEVIGNLLENAAKHAKTSVSIAIEATDSETPMMCLTIEDDGSGIAPQQHKAALKRGVRLDENTPGSGLGLSIVKDIVEDYGGHLELDPAELGGLKVVVFLPSIADTRRIRT